jgi:DNA polymerase-1
MFGRRRLLSDVDASDRDKGFLNRVAMNAPVQGSAADIVKLAMIRVNDVLKPFLPDVQMILQIHDELLFESETCKVEVVLPVIISTMEKAVELSVPLKVEVAVGSNWMDVQ